MHAREMKIKGGEYTYLNIVMQVQVIFLHLTEQCDNQASAQESFQGLSVLLGTLQHKARRSQGSNQGPSDSQPATAQTYVAVYLQLK